MPSNDEQLAICEHCRESIDAHHHRNLKCPNLETIYREVFVGADGKAFPETTDAAAWAKSWLRIIAMNPNVPTDEGTMIGWFANALMRGYDSRPDSGEGYVPGQSAVLDFEKWQLRWCADNGRKMTQTEYGIAMCAFYAAHPAEGPFSSVMESAPSLPGSTVPVEEYRWKCLKCGVGIFVPSYCQECWDKDPRSRPASPSTVQAEDK